MQADAYEFAEPRDIVADLKKEFCDGLASPKWSERKAALGTLREAAAYPRLAGSGDWGDVNRELKKAITKDSNIQVRAAGWGWVGWGGLTLPWEACRCAHCSVCRASFFTCAAAAPAPHHLQVVAEAILCVANIAKGLRREYKGPAMSMCPGVGLAATFRVFQFVQLTPLTDIDSACTTCARNPAVLLEKFKDKAAVVTRSAGEALDALSRHCFVLADVAEDVAAALAHQNPKARRY